MRRCVGCRRKKFDSILAAAAQFRLQRKTLRLQRLSELHGTDEALFQELAGTLGYKKNKLPFTLLAQRLPRQILRAQPNEIEAVLFGVGGFLDTPDLARFEPGTRQYLRVLWDQWWPRRAALERLILPRADLALERDATTQSSAPSPRRARRYRGLLAEAGAFVRRKRSRSGPEILSRFDASLLEFSLHAHLRSGTRGDGTRR